MTNYFPQQSVQYKTFVKRTMVSALLDVFKNHPEKLLNDTQVGVEYPRKQVHYPSIVIRFFERDIKNAGVGHVEYLRITGETPLSTEADVTLSGSNSLAYLKWDPVPGATFYRVYRATSPGIFSSFIEVRKTEFTDIGKTKWIDGTPPDVNTSPLDTPTGLTGTALPGGQMWPNTYRYAVTALTPSGAFKFKHTFYTGDIEFAIYGLTSLDRDLIGDTVVQTIRMGDLEAYTNRFLAKVYADAPSDSNVHIITFNTDLIQGFGENQARAPWGEEDSLIYTTSYRCRVWGEVYSIPPEVPFDLVRSVLLYPYIQDVEDVPTGLPDNDEPWEG